MWDLPTFTCLQFHFNMITSIILRPGQTFPLHERPEPFEEAAGCARQRNCCLQGETDYHNDSWHVFSHFSFVHIHLFENLCWTLVVPWLYIIRYKINTQCFLAGFWPPHPYTDLACGRNRHLWQPGGRRPRRGRGSRSRDQPQLGRGRPKSSSFLRCLTAWIWGTINWHQTILFLIFSKSRKENLRPKKCPTARTKKWMICSTGMRYTCWTILFHE